MSLILKHLAVSSREEPIFTWTKDIHCSEGRLHGKNSLDPWETITNIFFHFFTGKQVWLPLTIETLESNLRGHSMKLYLQTSELEDEFGIGSSHLMDAFINQRLERLIGEKMEDIQKQTLAFSDVELYHSGLTRETYNAIVLKLRGLQDLTKLPKNRCYFSLRDQNLHLSKKNHRRSDLVKITSGDFGIRIQTKIPFEKGASKSIFFAPNLTTGKIDVLSREQFDPADERQVEGRKVEAFLLETLKGKDEVIECREIQDKVKTQGTGATTQRRYAFEKCDVGSISDAFDELTPSEKLQAYKDFFQGLAYLHAMGYLHFDLHSNNLLLKRIEGIVRGKLIDFANARRLSQVQDPNYFLNSMISNPFWSAHWRGFSPEVLLFMQRCKGVKLTGYREFPVTTKSDIWQMGLTLSIQHFAINFSLMHLESYQKSIPPFLRFLATMYPQRESLRRAPPEVVKACIDAILIETPQPDDPTSINALFWAMLHPNPDKRPTAEECAQFFQRLLEEPV